MKTIILLIISFSLFGCTANSSIKNPLLVKDVVQTSTISCDQTFEVLKVIIFGIALLVLIAIIVCLVVEYKTDERIKNTHAYFSRLIFAILYFILGGSLIIYFKDCIFYLDFRDGLNDWPRFLWCVGCSLMGFGFAATQSRFSQSLPYFPYIFFYPCILSLITSLGYSLLSLYPTTRGYLFYPLAFALCGTLSFRIDEFKDFVGGFIKRSS